MALKFADGFDKFHLTLLSDPDNHYDRATELKLFDDTKAGVKGLVDAGITHIPRIFYRPPNEEDSDKISVIGEIQLSIPVIDIGDVDKDSFKLKAVVESIREACEKWGFFQLVNHGIPVTVLEEMKDGIHRFFEQDTDVKKQYYTRDRTKPVVYNSNFDLYSAPVSNWRDTFLYFMAPTSPNPQELPHVCRDILIDYSERIRKLGRLIFELISVALGLNPNRLIEMKCDECLAVISHYYPPCPQPKLAMGTTEHADNDFATVLLQDQMGGLQVLHENKWVDVPPVHGALVVNLGDLMQLISNDKFKSVQHRVLANDGGSRVSIASFFGSATLPSSQLLGPIKELLTEENPAKYREIMIKEYHYHFHGKGLDGTSALLPFRITS